MHPVLVKILPASVRRGYYEWVDYRLPRIFSRHWIYRAIHWMKYALIPSFRRREREKLKALESLHAAFSTGYSIVPPAQGQALVVEDLAPVMKVVTFKDNHLKIRRRRR